MATDLLTCCERLDESKYWHKCTCPTATVECESEQFDYLLCGFSEYAGDGIVASTPPKKYLREISEWEQYDRDQWNCCPYGADEGHHKIRSTTLFNSAKYEYLYNPLVDCDDYTIISEPSGCFVAGRHGEFSQTTQFCNSSPSSSTSCIPNLPTDILVVSTTRTTREEHEEVFIGGGSCAGELESKVDEVYSFVLSDEDTEQDAIDRATPVDGTSCSSRWETRNTQFDWIKRKSEYIIECENLVIGVEYEVTPTIRRRTALDDGSGEWEEVIVDPEIFTATETTKTFPKVLLGEDENDEGEIIQGYEYEITGVHIEKTL